MKQFFGENSLWAPSDYLSLGNGIISNCAVGIHVSEFRPENEILGRIEKESTFFIRMNGGRSIVE